MSVDAERGAYEKCPYLDISIGKTSQRIENIDAYKRIEKIGEKIKPCLQSWSPTPQGVPHILDCRVVIAIVDARGSGAETFHMGSIWADTQIQFIDVLASLKSILFTHSLTVSFFWIAYMESISENELGLCQYRSRVSWLEHKLSVVIIAN